MESMRGLVGRLWQALAALFLMAALPLAQAQQACIDNLAVRAKSGEVQLTWTHVDGTLRYDVARATALAGPFAALASTTSTYSTYLDRAVVNGTTYYYRITRVSAADSCDSGVIAAQPPKSRTRMAKVPAIVGDTQAQAAGEIAAASLAVGTVTQGFSNTVEAGRILSQDPPAGSTLPIGALVAFVVSNGPAPPTTVPVPDIVGLTQAAATDSLTASDLVVGSVTTAFSATVPVGQIISQDPAAGTIVVIGSAVSFVVSDGPAPPPTVAVPDVVGQTQAAAQTAITGAGLTVGSVTTAFSDTVPAGRVISQAPAGGTVVVVGSAVDLVVSDGPAPPPTVAVPNVVGLTQSTAEAAITGVGLVVGNVTTANSSTVPAGQVISQAPAGGTVVAVGSAVDLVVSIGASTSASALQLELSQVAIGAGGTVDVTTTALDAGGQPLDPQPAVALEVLAVPGASGGTLPSLAGSQVVTAADTRGAYLVRGTIVGSAISADAEFVVTQSATQSSNAAKFATLAGATGTVASQMDDLVAALQTGNNAVIPGISAALLAARDSVPITGRNAMQRSTVVAPERGFMPTLATLSANGYTETAADVAYGSLIGQIIAKLGQITTFLNTLNPASTNDDEAALNQLNADLAALQSQLVALDVSPHGITKHAGRINHLYANVFPAHLHAAVNRVRTTLQQQGLASLPGSWGPVYASADPAAAPLTPQQFYAQTRPAFFGLTGLMSGMSLQMDLVNRIYGPILADLSRVFVLLAANDLLASYLGSGDLTGIITGGSLSFHVFNQPGSVIEAVGINRQDPARTDVFVIGTNQIAAAEGVINAFNPSNVENLQDVFDFFEGIIDAVQGAGESYDQAHQLGSQVLAGCILDGGSNPACSQLVYPSGFKPVISCSGWFCLPQPVLFLVKNLDNGFWQQGAYNFAP